MTKYNFDRSRVECVDAGDHVADRYTAVIDGAFDMALGMSERPFHPQGFGMHVTASPEYMRDRERTTPIDFDDLPPDVQRCIWLDVQHNDEHAAAGGAS